MPDEINLVRMMAGLDLTFEKAIHYHDEGYESDNDYGLLSQVTRACPALLSLHNQGLL